MSRQMKALEELAPRPPLAPMTPDLRVVAPPLREEMTFERALFFWFCAALGLALAVLVMSVAVQAETVRLPGAGGRLENVPVIKVKIKGVEGLYVRLADIARILHGSYSYDPPRQGAAVTVEGRKVNLLVESVRFTITKKGAEAVSGRLPAAPVKYNGTVLVSRAAAQSLLKQYHTAVFKPLNTAVAERLPLPLKPSAAAAADSAAASTPAPPNATVGQNRPSPVSAGPVAPFIRNIVIDAGHGDHDPGAVGPGRLQEKAVNLAVATALAEQLKGRVAGKVTLTRKTDVFLPLSERVGVARKVNADLFISIHTNAGAGVYGRHATGTEVYFFSEPSDKDARLAEKLEGGPFDPSTEGIDPVLWNLMVAGNVVESHRLAETVDQYLPGRVGLPSRGVKSARFYVLYYGVISDIPSILIELGFVSNPDEEKKLRDPEWREKAAAAIADAVVEYLQDLERRYPGGKGWSRTES